MKRRTACIVMTTLAVGNGNSLDTTLLRADLRYLPDPEL
jgi:hypothetical protein